VFVGVLAEAQGAEMLLLIWKHHYRRVRESVCVCVCDLGFPSVIRSTALDVHTTFPDY